MTRQRYAIPKRRKSPIEKLYAYASDQDVGAAYAYTVLSSLPLDAMCGATRELRRTLSTKNNHVFGNIRADDYSELCDWSKIYYSENAREDIYVAAAEIRAFSEDLNRFISAEEEFDGLVLNGKFSDALNLLAEIESSLGLSLWSFSNRLSLLELVSGVDSQKTLVNEIRKREDIKPALRTFAYFFSLKAERTVSASRYEAAVAKAIDVDKDDSLSSISYLNFHLGFFSGQDIKNIITVLNFERGSSLVDRYLTFIRVAQLATTSQIHRNLLPHFQRAAKVLSEKIQDDRLEILLMKLNGAAKLGKNFLARKAEPVRRYLAVMDAYTRGEYSTVKEKIEDLPSNEQSRLVDLYCRSLARIGQLSDASASFELVRDPCVELLTKGIRTGIAFDQLIKAAYSFGYSQWALELYALACRETAAAGRKYRDGTFELGLLNGGAASPRLHLSLFGEHASEKLVVRSLTFRFLVNAFGAVSGLSQEETSSIPTNRLIRYRANALRNSGNIDEAIRELESLISTSDKTDPLDSQSVVTSLLSLNLEKGDVMEAARVAARALCRWPQLSTRIELGEVIFLYKEMSIFDEKIAPDIYATVCFGLSHEYYRPDVDSEIPIRCEQFLMHIGVDRPSALRTRLPDVIPEVISFFLYAMCKPEVLDSHIAYHAPSEVLDERVAILQWLIELDESKRSIYADEIAQITQKQLIRKGVQAIEKSRIQVDLEGIRNSIDKDFGELCTRFMTLPKDVTSLSDVVIRLSRDKEHGGVVLVLPVNERYAALLQLIHLVRDRFVSSNEHGLDVYLSVGIRHGTLSGQLRSVLEKWHLVSQKGKSGDYDSNDFWAKAFSEDGIDPEEVKRADEALQLLSRRCDELIAKLRDNWVQVRTEDKNPDGFFNFTVTNHEVAELGRVLDASNSQDQALDIVFDFLWKKTDTSLSNLRQVLKTRYKDEFSLAIDECLGKIGFGQEESSLQRLRSSLLRARTDVQSEIDDIAEWFTRNSDANVSDYQFGFAVDVALEMVSRCYPQHSLRLSPSYATAMALPGSTLKGIVEILFIAFDNMLKHCGKADGEVPSSMSHLRTLNSMCIELSSVVTDPVNVSEENQKLEQRLQLVLSDKTTDTVRREGGSGFFKIAKIVRVDFGSNLKLWFGYDNPTKFSLKIDIIGGSPFDEHISS